MHVGAMKQFLVSFDEPAGGARLSVFGLSTVDALRLFEPSTPIVITHFSSFVDIWRSRRYCSQDDIPPIATVGDAVSYLDGIDAELDLIDFDATVDNTALSTHDDGEATFHVFSKSRVIELLDAIFGPKAAASIGTFVLDHPGQSVLIEDGRVVAVSNTFEEVLASNRLA